MWKVKLKGHLAALDLLKTQNTIEPIEIIVEQSDVYLKMDTFPEDCDKYEIQEFATEMVRFLNVSLKIISCLDEEIEMDGFYWVDQYSQSNLIFYGVGTISAPLRLVVFDNNAIIPKPWPTTWIDNKNVQEVFRIFQQRNQDWFSLFKIYETIRDDPAHGETGRTTKNAIKNIEEWGGIDNNKTFFETANWHRHAAYGKSKGIPNKRPDVPMNASNAENYIRKLIHQWLNWKSA